MMDPKSLITTVFFLTVLYPYLSPVRTPFDIQPYALLAALLVLLAAVYRGDLKLPPRLWLLGVPALYALALLWIPGPPNFAGLRATTGYVSVFVITAATYLSTRYFNPRMLTVAIYVWLVVALLQILMGPEFGGSVLARFTPVSTGRGVASLATEPSHYATICFFFLLFVELFHSYGVYGRRQYLILVSVLVAQMLISFSALGLMLLLIFALLKFAIRFLARFDVRSFARAVVALFVIVAAGVVAFRIPAVRATRAVAVAQLVLRNREIILRDRSIAGRLENIVGPIVGFYRSRGIGLGLASWEDNKAALIGGGQTVVRFPRPRGRRIMSGWGTGLSELGVFGLGLIAVVSWIVIQGMQRDRRRWRLYLLILLSMHLAMVNATPLAYPPFAFLIGMCAVFARGRPHRLPRLAATSTPTPTQIVYT